MGKEKAGFLTPKAIANRIKAKGLQKLRWYCQMCNKQCRDENGFKCHCMSESHQRQMAMFSENSDRYMDTFSKTFEEGMMEIISRKARSQRIAANVIYREYISDRNHCHMNSTIWETLTDFVMYLGRTGKCEVDETEKGWFVTYIDRDPEKLKRMEERAKRERTELDSEERHERDLMKQAKIAREALGEAALAPAATELRRDDPEQKVSLSIGGTFGAKAKVKTSAPSCSMFAGVEDEETGEKSSADSSGKGGAKGTSGGGSLSKTKAPTRAIESLIAEETKRKDIAVRKDYWLQPDLVVKVLNKQLKEGKYYKQKGTVEKVIDRYTARVRMHASGDLIQLDQDELETVIPKEGSRVLIVNGAYRGSMAQLVSINMDDFCVAVKISDGVHAGRTVERVEYEDVCKLDIH